MDHPPSSSTLDPMDSVPSPSNPLLPSSFSSFRGIQRKKRNSTYSSFTSLSIYQSVFRRPFDPFRLFPFIEILLRSLHSFVLAFGVKAGIALLLKWVRLLTRSHSWTRQKWWFETLQATLYNQDAYRLATFFAFFTGLFHTTLNGLIAWRPHWSLRHKGFVAGMVAGLSIMVESKATRITFVQQGSMRALQAIYNGLKGRQLVSFPVGDSLLFILSSAHIMYAFIRHPTTLPFDLLQFMSTMAHLPQPVLEANQRVLFRQPYTSPALLMHLENYKSLPHVREWLHLSHVPALPCAILHPTHASCSLYNGLLWIKVFSKIFPVYFTLHFVPGLLLKTKQILTTPFEFLFRAFRNTLRSCSFLSTYVTTFHVLVCWHRQSVKKGWLPYDHKLYYYVFGLINAACAIFLEAKQRRSELGMYVAPKAIHSFYLLATSKQWLPRPPFADVALFSLFMGVIMSVYLTEIESLSPMVARILKRFIF
ncbi:hypothetical protein HMI54_011046 [Coelomomyces lativittatus]|nr:hypothetical protein HMI56_000212 [Coelomomyces lativittatus]KAJ1514168.1 hypothetical protein HMI55_004902 [Coelomomyces lativittatus]KAJ1516043.1 hypothetical protein HMI54_011046 [Coelomomyces lativittatus]